MGIAALPDRSTLAGGLAGVVSWAAYLVLAHYGVPVTQEQLSAFLLFIIPVVVHIVPDKVKAEAGKVDVLIKNIATDIPKTYAAPTDFPGGDGVTVNVIPKAD